jgi:hypothetical protein
MLMTVALGALLAVAFPFVERRAEEPILPLGLFRNRVFTVTSLIGFVVGLALFGSITYLPLYLQVVNGHTPNRVGFVNSIFPPNDGVWRAGWFVPNESESADALPLGGIGCT